MSVDLLTTTKERIDAPSRSVVRQQPFWVSMILMGVVVVLLGVQYQNARKIQDMETAVGEFIDSRIEVAPADVLKELQSMREEFQSLLQNNPELKPPTNGQKNGI